MVVRWCILLHCEQQMVQGGMKRGVVDCERSLVCYYYDDDIEERHT